MKKMIMTACVMACAVFMVGYRESSSEGEKAYKKAELESVNTDKDLEKLWPKACNGSQDAIKKLRKRESRCWRQIDSADNISSPAAEGLSSDNKKGGFELEDSNKNFRFTSGKKMPEALEKVRPDATLMDLYDFAHVVCYNNHLLPLLKNNKPLTKHDLQLLCFVLDVTSSTIVAMSASMLGDMVFDQKDNVALQALSKDHRELADFIRSFVDAQDSKMTIRQQIKSFANRFSDVAYEHRSGIFFRADLSSFVSDDSRKDSFLERHPVISAIAVMTVFGGFVIGDYNITHSSVEPVEAECAKIKGYEELGDEWGRLCDAAEIYLKFYASIYKVLNSYSPVDNASMRAVVDLLGKSGACRDKTVSTYCLAFYDVPFVLVLYRTRYEYRKCKGVHDDDEKGMEEALIRLNQTVGGTRVLEHVGSAFALDLYTKCIADIKDEYMLPSNFNTIISKTALKAKASKTNRFDSETGLPLNDLTEKKENK